MEQILATKVTPWKDFMNWLRTYTSAGIELPEGSTYVTVTPDDIRDTWDEIFLQNREYEDTCMLQYHNAMKGGYWEEHIGNTILIDKNGKLTDAHHTLCAIKMLENTSDRTYEFTFLLQFGVIPSMWTDTGKKRTTRNNIAMNRALSPEDVELFSGEFGKVLNVFCTISHNNKNKIIEANYINYASTHLRSVAKAFMDTIEYSGASRTILPTKKTIVRNPLVSKAGALAALFDLFLKGTLDSEEIVSILICGLKYAKAAEAKKKGMPEFKTFRNEATEYEQTVFGTSVLFESLIDVLPGLSSGEGQKNSYHLVTKAITFLKSNKDEVIQYNNGAIYAAEKKKSLDNLFNIFEIENHELYTKNINGGCVCFVRPIQAA